MSESLMIPTYPEECADSHITAMHNNGSILRVINLNWLNLMDHEHGLQLVSNTEALLKIHGATQDEDVATHCKNHMLGLSHMTVRRLDFSRIYAYNGSWPEWSNRCDTPIETRSN